MPPVNDTQLSEMEVLLKTGPIVIGENHEQDYARVAIGKLWKKGVVKYLSVELPFCPERWTSNHGGIMQKEIQRYFTEIKVAHRNRITLRQLAEDATEAGIPVYFHDRPKVTQMEQLHFQDNNYPESVRKLAGNFTGSIPLDFSNKRTARSDRERLAKAEEKNQNNASNLVQRNTFTANSLKDRLGNGVRILIGLVILAGDEHLLPAETGPGQTIQALLNIPEDRVRHCI